MSETCSNCILLEKLTWMVQVSPGELDFRLEWWFVSRVQFFKQIKLAILWCLYLQFILHFQASIVFPILAVHISNCPLIDLLNLNLKTLVIIKMKKTCVSNWLRTSILLQLPYAINVFQKTWCGNLNLFRMSDFSI